MTARPARSSSSPGNIAVLHDSESLDFATDLRDILIQDGFDVMTLHDISEGLPPATENIISTVDLQVPFFENIKPEAFEAFRTLITEASNRQASIFWLTRTSQVKCTDPRWGQTIGAARSIRNELNLNFATCEVDQISSQSLLAVSRVFKKFQKQKEGNGNLPDYEYCIVDGEILVSRLYPVSVNHELESGNQDASRSSSHDLKVGKYGRLSTLSWSPRVPRPLLNDEVVVEAKAVGMNFKVGQTSSNISGCRSLFTGCFDCHGHRRF